MALAWARIRDLRRDGAGLQRGFYAPRQQCFERLDRGGLRQLLEQIAQIGVRLDSVDAGAAHQRLQIRTCSGTIGVLREQPCSSAGGERSDLVFEVIVVDR